ncbi:Apoptosis-antagonizing transcription factor [Gracilaria domingensis]|nr:Apoptosis-antagonizing transcription factor [Gracilaria domingensis]
MPALHLDDPLQSDQSYASSGETGSSHQSSDDENGPSSPSRPQAIAPQLSQLQKEESAVAKRLARAHEKQLERAHALLKQKSIYDSIVNLRIKLQPILELSGKLPPVEQRGHNDRWSSPDAESAIAKAEASLNSLFVEADDAWKASWPADRNESFQSFSTWRTSVLDHWGRKVSEATGAVPKGGFKAFDTTVTAQVKSTLATGKHLERSRKVKESLELIGGAELSAGSHAFHYDDSELYRCTLREIIESGEGNASGLRLDQLSKRGRVRKKRDGMSAKGRKLKYDVHEKLVGFLTPMPLPDGGPVDEILMSLFGNVNGVKRGVEN